MIPNNNSRPKKEVSRNLTEREKEELERLCVSYAKWLWNTFQHLHADDAAWAGFEALTDFPDKPRLKKAPLLERSKNRQTTDT